jgi:hypothetical protein
MQFLRTLFSKLPLGTRRYAQVHDITIKADNKILGSMEIGLWKREKSRAGKRVGVKEVTG